MDLPERLHVTHQGMKKIVFARALRKRMTKAESFFWNAVRDRRFDGHKFRRQVPLGQYVADFCCMKGRLIIELDGEIHDKIKEFDAEREVRLRDAGFKIVRFTNEKVLHHLPEVFEELKNILSS